MKCVLKPVIERINKIKEEKKSKEVENTSPEKGKQQQASPELEALSDPDHEDDHEPGQSIGDPLLHASSYSPLKRVASDAPSVYNDLSFEMGLNFIYETLLSIKPEDLGLLFLVYDCQHFSESLITKSINLLLKYTKSNTPKFN